MKVLECNDAEQSEQSYVLLQSSILSNPNFFKTNEKFVIKDLNGAEKILQLPNLSETTLGTFSQDKIINRDLPLLWLLSNHKI